VSIEDDARRHRARLVGVTFVAVTGSCGKTTTKDLTTRVLSCRLSGRGSSGSYNCGSDLAQEVLAVNAGLDFFVQELAAWGPGTMEPGLSLVRPHIGVVTNLRNDHFSAFGGPRGAQAEKGKLLVALPASGTAVLNWDDPLVRELAEHTSARVLRVGCSLDADLRAIDVSARWPERLSFTLVHGRQQVRVRTRLVGEHVLGSVLAAIGVGVAHDIPLLEAAQAVETAEPTPRRMSVMTFPDGVTFIRDDFKAPADSIPEVLRFLAEATASRKIAIFGRISDYPGRSRPTYEHVARTAATVADVVVFVGERATALWGRAVGDVARLRLRTEVRLHAYGAVAPVLVYPTVHEAAENLSDTIRSGDLVLLKGSGPADHLERIMLCRDRSVRCWLEHCGRVIGCDDCSMLPTG
jgi:UDP-N-acetylmuramoyl-tripeptide--D-alanyl-D-alanine ligase